MLSLFPSNLAAPVQYSTVLHDLAEQAKESARPNLHCLIQSATHWLCDNGQFLSLY